MTGVLLLASYLLVFRHHLALIPVAAAVLTGLTVLREGLIGGSPGAAAGAAVGGAIIVVLGVLWSQAMERDSRAGPPSPTSA
jgi:hypothetical protein